jgi:hypothetical protein
LPLQSSKVLILYHLVLPLLGVVELVLAVEVAEYGRVTFALAHGCWHRERKPKNRRIRNTCSFEFELAYDNNSVYDYEFIFPLRAFLQVGTGQIPNLSVVSRKGRPFQIYKSIDYLPLDVVGQGQGHQVRWRERGRWSAKLDAFEGGCGLEAALKTFAALSCAS